MDMVIATVVCRTILLLERSIEKEGMLWHSRVDIREESKPVETSIKIAFW